MVNTVDRFAARRLEGSLELSAFQAKEKITDRALHKAGNRLAVFWEIASNSVDTLPIIQPNFMHAFSAFGLIRTLERELQFLSRGTPIKGDSPKAVCASIMLQLALMANPKLTINVEAYSYDTMSTYLPIAGAIVNLSALIQQISASHSHSDLFGFPLLLTFNEEGIYCLPYRAICPEYVSEDAKT